MKRPILELLIVALFSIPIGALGVSALLSQRVWVTPRNSGPVELTGASANLMGLGYLSLAAALFAVWLAFRSPYRKLGVGLIGLCAAFAGVGFAGAFSAL